MQKSTNSLLCAVFECNLTMQAENVPTNLSVFHLQNFKCFALNFFSVRGRTFWASSASCLHSLVCIESTSNQPAELNVVINCEIHFAWTEAKVENAKVFQSRQIYMWIGKKELECCEHVWVCLTGAMEAKTGGSNVMRSMFLMPFRINKVQLFDI